MGTRKQDAKTVDQLRRECYDRIVSEHRIAIESSIVEFGQFGFNICLESTDLTKEPRGFDYGEVAKLALETLVEEYRLAGWKVDYYLQEPSVLPPYFVITFS